MNYKLQELLPLMNKRPSEPGYSIYISHAHMFVTIEYTDSNGVDIDTIVNCIVVHEGEHPLILTNHGTLSINQYGKIGVKFRVFTDPKVIE